MGGTLFLCLLSRETGCIPRFLVVSAAAAAFAMTVVVLVAAAAAAALAVVVVVVMAATAATALAMVVVVVMR